jgi:hypothetical protein
VNGVLRPLARSLAGVARAIDRRIGRLAGRRRVVVEARTPMNLAVLQPVFGPLLQDPRLDVRFTGTDRADLERAFTAAGLRDQVVPRHSVTWMRVDLYVNADPWAAVKLRRAARQLNFFHGVAGKYDLDCPTALPLNFARYDRVAFPNEGRLASYLAAGLVGPRQAALIGYPKVDVLATDRPDTARAARALGLDPVRPTAIFAPTFSTASALHVAGEAIIDTLLACGCNVIVKLHDRSLDPDVRYSGGIDWRTRLGRFAAGGRFLLADSGDSTPYVLASDLMVSDHSSIAFEFCVVDRPLILFDAPRLASTARINAGKIELLRSAAPVVRDMAALAAAVRASLAAPETRSADRRRVANEVFHRAGGAAERAVRLVYELLDLQPAAACAGSHPVRAWSLE